MKTRTTLPISLCFTDEKEIERVKKIYDQGNLGHKDIYLLGIASIEELQD